MPTRNDPGGPDGRPTRFRDREEAAVHLTEAIRARIAAIRRTLARLEPTQSEQEGDGEWAAKGSSRAHGAGNGLVGALSRPIVIGIPRGGVETAAVIARLLPAEFDLVVSRKLGYPQNPELAFGAIAEEGGRYMRPEPSGFLTREIIESVEEIEQTELQRRVRVYRKGRPLTPLRGRFVIVADDGIATGCTMFATLQTVRHREPARIMVAAPAASPEIRGTLESLVDDVVIPLAPPGFHAVSQIYDHFPGLSDKDVIRLVAEARKEGRLAGAPLRG